MPALLTVALGYFAGLYALQARYETVWWPYFGGDVSSLKSKVTAQLRTDAEAFYRQLRNAPPNFDYVAAVLAVLVLLSLIGGIVQFKSKRLYNLLSLTTFIAAAAIEVIYARPLLDTFKTKSYVKPEIQSTTLYHLALYHAISLALIVVTIFTQVFAEEQEEAEAARVPADRKKKTE
eukprot:jgi/Hompol1/6520/HPOL_005008-RA